MAIKVNLRDIEVKDFDPIPAGTYDVVVAEGEETETKGDGKLGKGVPMIKWTLEVCDNNNEKLNGRKLFTNSIIHPTTLWNLKAFLLATGEFDEDDLKDEIDFEIDDIVGCKMLAVVTVKDYEGAPTNNVRRVKPIGGSASTSTGGKEPSLLP